MISRMKKKKIPSPYTIEEFLAVQDYAPGIYLNNLFLIDLCERIVNLENELRDK